MPYTPVDINFTKTVVTLKMQNFCKKFCKYVAFYFTCKRFKNICKKMCLTVYNLT